MKTFLFLYPNLLVGGIETWLINQIRFAIENGIRIIWITNGKGLIFDEWKDLINNNVEIYKDRSVLFRLISVRNLKISSEDEVISICFGFTDYAKLLVLKEQYACQGFHCFNIIPHFKNAYYYPEEAFKNPSRKLKDRIANVYRWCDENNGLLFFNKRHIEEIENRYHLIIDNKNEKLTVSTTIVGTFDEKLARNRAKREEFRIITCGRFAFPHKAYMIGLVRAFNELKPLYQKLKLDIIGYGDGKEELLNEINRCSEISRRDIRLLGAVLPEKLHEYYDIAHLNIAVAGSVGTGAKYGLVSIPARHYCYDCEVYGFLPESMEKALSDMPGEDVKKYIVELLKMTDNDYYDKCKQSYNTCRRNQHSSIDTQWLFNLRNQEDIPNHYRETIRICAWIDFLFRFKRYKGYVHRALRGFLRNEKR